MRRRHNRRFVLVRKFEKVSQQVAKEVAILSEILRVTFAIVTPQCEDLTVTRLRVEANHLELRLHFNVVFLDTFPEPGKGGFLDFIRAHLVTTVT